jgi:putative transcription factor
MTHEMSYSIQKAIMQARMAKKMSQEDLAKQVCVTADVIQKYENGKAAPNNAFIAKLERILGVKLPRAKKKPVDSETGKT